MKFSKISSPQLNWTMHREQRHLQSFLEASSSQFCVVRHTKWSSISSVKTTNLCWGCSRGTVLLELTYIQDYTSLCWGKNPGTWVSVGCQDIWCQKCPLMVQNGRWCVRNGGVVYPVISPVHLTPLPTPRFGTSIANAARNQCDWLHLHHISVDEEFPMRSTFEGEQSPIIIGLIWRTVRLTDLGWRAKYRWVPWQVNAFGD